MDVFGEFADLMELADLIAERLENPITIEDMNHHVVAYSMHDDATDPVRIQTIMKRKVPESVLVRFWKDGVIQALMHSDDPVRIPAARDVGLDSRVAVSIRRGTEVFGYIWVQEANRTLEDADLIVLKQAARLALPGLLHRKNRYEQNEGKRKQLLWRLLSRSRETDSRAVEKEAHELGVSLSGVLEVLVFEASCSEGVWERMQKELAYLLEHLGDFFVFRQLLLWTFDGRHLIVLAGMHAGEEKQMHEASRVFVNELQTRLTRRFGQEYLAAGHGNPVLQLGDIWRSYQQALEVLHLKNCFPIELAGAVGYSELGIYRLFPKMKQWNEEQGYQNDKLVRLVTYDQQNQSNLVETLDVFLRVAGKVNTAAQQLHIHPNTLAYRLKRISEVGGIDLQDANDRVTLFLDLQVQRYQQ
ncbi:DNA-binding PucR family transcriptional regulator [Aneurinibacillus soli]|uniref:Purine catabolism regulatory protein n=1 Tax=Aneurinibacillus soli TaxID=1500254 RepID=A0A0U4WD03_9BACL|nr:helix-turn-helix domain-containing protein [Aneurinibacillus soli]PYE59329.1 DNA-binding PucR family transcriptional regulator [Aneurinibacillus soli]BAU26681.1 Purine catabolism regulatory protein [Aneurinibacillus soli]